MNKKTDYTRYIFYHPVTLEVKGMSDSEHSLMGFPYIQVEQPYFAVNNIKLIRQDNGDIKVKHIKGTLPEGIEKENVFKPVKRIAAEDKFTKEQEAKEEQKKTRKTKKKSKK